MYRQNTHRNPSRSINGYRQRISSSDQSHSNAGWNGKIYILDLRHIREQIKSDRSLWLAREVLDVNDIIEGLIDEDMGPREYPAVLDHISDYVDNSPELQQSVSDDTLDIVSIQLDLYQIQLDEIITKAVSSQRHFLNYELVRWLGEYTAVVAVNISDECTRHVPHPLHSSTLHPPIPKPSLR